MFDPFFVIIKLAICSKKPIGIKLSIKNYIIEIQEPTIYQNVLRYLNDDNILDYQNLFDPINKACNIYLVDEYYKKNNKILNIFEYAKEGLIILMKTYKKNRYLVLYFIYLHKIIDVHIENIIHKRMFKNELINTFVVFENNLYTPRVNKNDKINNITNYWTYDKIDYIIHMMDNYLSSNLKLFDQIIEIIGTWNFLKIR
jgi:hypothetical protein